MIIMLSYLIFWSTRVEAVDVRMSGEVILKVIGVSENYIWSRADQDIERNIMKVKNLVTVGPVVECKYQYPEQAQVDALLSNMMNELTKVFMKARNFIRDDDDTSSSVDTLRMSSSNQKSHRFRVVDKKSTDFFENIFKNMTHEYQAMVNVKNRQATSNERETCANQEAIKQLWRDILDNSIKLLHSAARATIQEHLKMQNITLLGDSRIDEFLAKEIGKVRTNQLDLLCNQFQLCYSNLLKSTRQFN